MQLTCMPQSKFNVLLCPYTISMSINLLGSDFENTSMSARFLIKQQDFYETEKLQLKVGDVQGFVPKALIFLVFQGEKYSISIKFYLQETCSAT